MERLTFRSSDGQVHATRVGYYDIIEKLAQYEDLEEQGLLLKLPCKVGDVVWHERKFSHLSGVHPYQITNVMISQNKKANGLENIVQCVCLMEKR